MLGGPAHPRRRSLPNQEATRGATSNTGGRTENFDSPLFFLTRKLFAFDRFWILSALLVAALAIAFSGLRPQILRLARCSAARWSPAPRLLLPRYCVRSKKGEALKSL
ncbi:hypothetical protein NL676_024652 [Syzygium grande]|nr:hypothetical protein NL676_024652 [Syzygium grande]